MERRGAFDLGGGMIAPCASCGHAASTHHIDLGGACRSVTPSVPGPDAFRMLCGCRRYADAGPAGMAASSFGASFATGAASR